MPSPQAQDKWEQYAEPTDKWEQFAESSPEKEAFAHPPIAPIKSGVLDRPAMPGTSRRGVPVSTDPRSKLTPAMQKSRDIPFEAAKVVGTSIPLMVAPEAAVPGAIANVLGRGVSAYTGASYGGKKAAEFGLPKEAGQLVGGAVGLFAPEVIGKLSGPLISRIATVLGKSAPEVATVIAEDSTLANKVGRDVVERAARGEPLTPKEEELLFDQVQKHYTPEAGVESSAKKAGKIYAGRGTNLRPTNEQLALAKRTGVPPPPEPTPVTTGGSGESGASAEAINRTAAEKRGGVKYFIEDTRTKSRVPVSSVDVNSGLRVGPGKRIIRSSPEGEFEF